MRWRPPPRAGSAASCPPCSMRSRACCSSSPGPSFPRSRRRTAARRSRSASSRSASSVVIGVLPWHRWPRSSTLVLLPPTFALIALYNIVGGDDGFRYAPFFFVTFGWIGLVHRRGTSAAVVPLAAAAYLVPLALRGRVVGNRGVVDRVRDACGRASRRGDRLGVRSSASHAAVATRTGGGIPQAVPRESPTDVGVRRGGLPLPRGELRRDRALRVHTPRVPRDAGHRHSAGRRPHAVRRGGRRRAGSPLQPGRLAARPEGRSHHRGRDHRAPPRVQGPARDALRDPGRHRTQPSRARASAPRVP